MTAHSKFAWDIKLKIGNYDLPKGVAPNDYVTFEAILNELKMTHQNQHRIDHVSSELARNSTEDWWVRIGCVITSAIATGALILSKIKKIRETPQVEDCRKGPARKPYNCLTHVSVSPIIGP